MTCQGHYNDIATHYDDLYDFWNVPLAKTIFPLLDLHPSTSMVDIGGGTGAVADTISKLLGFDLKEPICVVDPSVGLIEEARKKSNLTTLVATADDFFKTGKKKYNRILLCQCVHHLPNCDETFKAMYDFLPSGGKSIITVASKKTRLPLWKSLQENFGICLSNEMQSLIKCGFNVCSSDAELPLFLSKQNWYNKIRQRIFSSLTTMTDEEIEMRIEEIDRTLLCDVKDDEVIEMIYNMSCLVATKP